MGTVPILPPIYQFMPREARIIIPNFPYHILNRGNNKEIIFFEDGDFRFFLRQVKKYKEKFGVKIYHHCEMPNHFHFLGEPPTLQSLGKFMHGIMFVYAQWLQRKYGKSGHIWQGRYKSSLIEKEDYLVQCGYYIEDNPRRAGLVKNLEDWPWSSYQFYAFGKPDPIVDIDLEYLKLGATSEERQERYRKFIMMTQEEKWSNNIREKLAQGILGSEKFVKEIVERFKIKLAKPGQRGRPSKR